jgi:hypothetical protein
LIIAVESLSTHSQQVGTESARGLDPLPTGFSCNIELFGSTNSSKQGEVHGAGHKHAFEVYPERRHRLACTHHVDFDLVVGTSRELSLIELMLLTVREACGMRDTCGSIPTTNFSRYDVLMMRAE